MREALTALLDYADPQSEERIELEARLGARRFRAFFRMCWPQIDPARYQHNWHYDLVCDEMEAVARRENRELVLCVPPRSSKSSIVSVAFEAWVRTWFPAAKFITASYDQKLAMRDSVRTRALIKSAWYQRRWGPDSPYRPDTNTTGTAVVRGDDNKGLYSTTAGGYRFVCTPGSNVTGWGADFILCDDPHPVNKAESEAERQAVLDWWFEAIPTRLNRLDQGVKMVIQQRVHREDLAGACIARGYHHVVLPMEFEPDHPQRHPKDIRTEKGELLHAARFSAKDVEMLKRALGTYAASGQLQQRPVPREGGLFKRGWFRVVDAAPVECFLNAVRRWDLAATVPKDGSKPDWTASVFMGRDAIGRIFIMHACRFQETPAMVDSNIKAIASQDGLGVRLILPLDPGQAGIGRMEAQSRFLAPYAAEFVRETGSKAERARGLAAMAEAGNVYLVRGPWNDEFLSELADFPNGSHDDYVDAASGAFSAHYTSHDGLMEWMRANASSDDIDRAALMAEETFRVR
jgi:predicted phage terminase large subunit-like protein